MNTLSLIGPAVIWAGPLLSILLGLEKMFQPDVDDGTFDVYRLAPLPLEAVVLAKATAFWLAFALPLILISPLFAMMLGMEARVMAGCVISLIIGSPALVFIGSLCATLTVKLRRAGLLVSILAIPLLVPTLIFGVTAARGFGDSTTPLTAPLYLLAALSIFAVVLSCAVSAKILRS